MTVDTQRSGVSEAIADLFGGSWEPITDECRWCARNVRLAELSVYPVFEEPCPEDTLDLCPDCDPRREVV